MVSTSKVLTVSYGTFSCTLEGFDDSFDTMKAIAEYFRDLAADDRYFGAEPPTPDAEMLARIAEKEIARRVEARFEGDNIVLRTSLPGAAKVNGADETSATEDEAQAEPTALNDEPEATQIVIPDIERANAETAETDGLAPEFDISPIEAASEDQADDLVDETVGDAEDDAETTDEDIAGTTENSDENEDDSIAAKLARIRAVVGQPQQEDAAPTYSEDEHADEILDTLPGDTDLADIITDPVEDAETAEDDQDDTIANVMGHIASAEIADAEPAKEAAPEIEMAEIETPEIEAAEIEASAPEPEEVAEQQPVAEETPVAPIAEEDTSEAEAAPATPRRPIRARVIKMKRAEFEQAIADGALEEVTDDASENASDGSQNEATSLTPEDEDELQRELAAVEAELAGLEAADTDVETDHEPHAEPEKIAPAAQASAVQGREDLAHPPEAEMDRLISQTHNELEEPEGKQRRSALGHLRAAVAAARADKDAGTPVAKDDDTEAYRSDLDEAVRPARPVRRVTGQAPERVSPAPLKLVAEQRVDLPQEEAPATPTRPVRPRRVAKAEPVAQVVADAPAETMQDEAPAQDVTEISADGTFMEFAEVMGATELPDLLEAAAAYLAFVEGRDQFSRPQLMTKVRMVQEENFSREDGLRSFGQLLRQGKIEKIAGGRFTVSDRISFKPDTRAAG